MDTKSILLIIATILIAWIIIYYIYRIKKESKPKDVINDIKKKLENCC